MCYIYLSLSVCVCVFKYYYLFVCYFFGSVHVFIISGFEKKRVRDSFVTRVRKNSEAFVCTLRRFVVWCHGEVSLYFLGF